MAPPVDDHHLDHLRQLGDEEADLVAAELREQHPYLDESDLVRLVLRNIATGREPGDTRVRKWLLDGPDLPEWADRDQLQAGQAFFGDWPLAITAALFCVALPSAYAAADGARVLALTSDLATKNAARRVAETGQMLMDVMDMGRESPDALEPGGQGYLTIRGVRLLHAVVRQTLVADPRWHDEWGRPINQEDLLGTLLTFTVAVFRGLDRLGIPYETGGADAYLHTWCVIGELLGIRPGILPIDRRQADELGVAIAGRHHRGSEAGDRLMAALLAQMEMSMPWGLRKLPPTLVHHLLPSDVVALFALPPPARWRPVLALGTRAAPVLARVPGGIRLVQAPTGLVGRSMIRMYVDRALEGEGPPFRVDAATASRLSIGRSQVRRTLRTRRRRIRARKQE